MLKISSLTVLGLIALTSTSNARSLLQVVREANKGQSNQIAPIEVKIAPGQGVTVSFLPSTQYITKAWLDNPAFVTLDSDGCLAVTTGNCTETTKVLHLKRINDLAIQGLPKTSSTLLTVITDGPNGGGVYLFRIAKAKSAKKLIYEIVPPPATLSPALPSLNPNPNLKERKNAAQNL